MRHKRIEQRGWNSFRDGTVHGLEQMKEWNRGNNGSDKIGERKKGGMKWKRGRKGTGDERARERKRTAGEHVIKGK